jgi:pimeloyl-ACP methyl ester carboxylesterase
LQREHLPVGCQYRSRPWPPGVAEHYTRGEELRFDFRPRLGEIRCPVLLLAGELDPAVPIEDAEELAAALPPDRVRFVRIADAGHMLAAEQPEAVLPLIREFVLEEPEQAAAADTTRTV